MNLLPGMRPRFTRWNRTSYIVARSVYARQLARGFNVRRMEIDAKRGESDSSSIFGTSQAGNFEVRRILEKRSKQESAKDIFMDIGAPVADALSKMSKYRTRALMVLDGQKIEGILTGRDYVRKVLAKGKRSDQVTCADIMTPRVKCVALMDSLSECVRRMAGQDIHHLPVLNVIDVQDSQGKYYKRDILTILSVKDLIRALLSVCSSSSLRKEESIKEESIKEESIKKITMGAILHEKGHNFIMARQEDTVELGVQLLCEHNIGSLLINEGTKMVTGIVTETDFVRKAKNFEKQGIDKHTLRDLMTVNPICISPDFTLDQALQMFLEKDFHHLPFIDFIGQSYDEDARCLGVVSITDVLRILSKDTPMLHRKYGSAKQPRVISDTRTPQQGDYE